MKFLKSKKNRHILLYILFINISLEFAYAQGLVKIEYYDKDWGTAYADKFYYQRLILKESDSLFIIKDLIKGKQLEMLGYAKSINPVVEHGTFTFYDKNEKPYATYEYKNGELLSANIDNNGKALLLDYGPKTEYKNINTDLNKIKQQDTLIGTVTAIQPSYPGGIENFRICVAGKLHYPQMAVKYKKAGTVYVAMVIGIDGKITDVNVLKSVYKDLDKEAMRAIRQCPGWTPLMENGVPKRCIISLPVVFASK